MLLVSLASAASLLDGCPSPGSLEEALALRDLGYEQLPVPITEVEAPATAHFDERSCRSDGGTDSYSGSVTTLCAGTDGVASLERESWDRVDRGAASLETGSLDWTAEAPGALGWSWIGIEEDDYSEGDSNGYSYSFAYDVGWTGTPDATWPADTTESYAYAHSEHYMTMAEALSEEASLGACSFWQSWSSWVDESTRETHATVIVGGADWEGQLETLHPAACADGRLPYRGTWNGTMIGAVDADGVPDPADGDLDGWASDCGDCDDTDPGVSPDAPEVPDDGIDQDCDGADAASFTAVRWRLSAHRPLRGHR